MERQNDITGENDFCFVLVELIRSIQVLLLTLEFAQAAAQQNSRPAGVRERGERHGKRSESGVTAAAWARRTIKISSKFSSASRLSVSFHAARVRRESFLGAGWAEAGRASGAERCRSGADAAREVHGMGIEGASVLRKGCGSGVRAARERRGSGVSAARERCESGAGVIAASGRHAGGVWAAQGAA